jgi:hypothetical protein
MRRVALAGAALALFGCGKDPTVVPVRNLERPSDMSFVCMRSVLTSSNTTQLSGRPLADCQPHLASSTANENVETVDFAKQRRTGTFGLVTNTARGELGVIDLDLDRLVDLDPTQPGYNMLPLGTFPEVVSASQDGCMAVTANRGSCDLTVVDTQRLLRPNFDEPAVSTGDGPLSVRVTPKTASGRDLHVAPQEIAFLPQKVEPAVKVTGSVPAGLNFMPSDPLPAATPVCAAPKAGQPAPWRAVVTFPGCDLVAVVELPSGTILSSMYVRPEGLVDAGTEPVCPADCGAGVAPQPAPDAAPADAAEDAMSLPPPVDVAPPAPDASDGDAGPVAAPDAAELPDAGPGNDGAVAADAGPPPAPPKGPFRIGALAIRPEGNRLYLGGASAEFLTAVDLDPATGLLVAPASGSRIPLHEGPGGVRRLRLSLDPHRVTATGRVGVFLGGEESKQYLYAFARDNSVRVLELLDPRDKKLREHECDVNVDPRFISGTVLDCYELSDAPGAPRPARRAFAQGPGLRIPSIFNPDQPSPVPQDIAFAPVPANVTSVQKPDWNTGSFGYLLSSDREIYVLNIDSLLSGSPVDNSFRDENQGPLGQAGPPVVPVIPNRAFNVTNVPLPIRVPLAAFEGARLEGIHLDPTNRASLNWVRFPDPTAANPQAWVMAWEGVLPGTELGRGEVLPPGTGPAGALRDEGQEFCQAGVLAKDIVLFPGCSQDTECSSDGTRVCRQALPGTPGLCFPVAQAKDTQLLALCSRHLNSRRRYQVEKSTTRQLDLSLKPDELPKTAQDRCTRKEDCSKEPFEGFDCLQVRAGEPKRCVKPCEAMGRADDTLCRTGTVCERIPGALTGPLCVEGPPILPACWPLGARYEVQAGNSFLVSGGLAPRPPTAREMTDTGICVADNARNPLLVNRVPLDAPHCAGIKDEDPENTVALFTGGIQLPSGPPETFGNPCLFWGVNDDDACARVTMNVPNPEDASKTISVYERPREPAACRAGCAPGPDGTRPTGCHVKAFFQNPQVMFVVTNLEQYAGDGNASRFDVIGGFRPDTVQPRDDIIVTMGVRIVTGPTANPNSLNFDDYVPYVYVIDQGRTSSSGGGRGQVLRFNPRAGTYGYPQFDSNYSLYPFQIQ